MKLQSFSERSPFDHDAVIGFTNDALVTVYQAFNHSIADEALKLQRFGANFSLNRMSWIKTSFFWMMYRAGWATKDIGQHRILAIDLPLTTVNEWIGQAVLARDSRPDTDILIQMDPDRDPAFRPLVRRAIQMGLRGDALRRYAFDAIQRITDITELALENKARFDRGEIADIKVPMERPIWSQRELSASLTKP